MSQSNSSYLDIPLSLFDVSWDDVLFPLVCSRLSLKDLFSLRCVSVLAKEFVDEVFGLQHNITLSGNNSKNIDLAFRVLARNCHRLETLYLAKCEWLTDELLLPLLARNKGLLDVNLNECINVSAVGLQPLITDCKELRELKLSKCQWLTTGAVDALTLHQSQLEQFDISHCTAIGERCLIICFRQLRKLTVLSLAYTPSVSDNVLIMISRYLHDLEHLNLVGCNSISDYGVDAIATNCTKLQSLMIQFCARVTERSLAKLRGRVHIDRPRSMSTALVPYGLHVQV